jgi:hypothetical protein
VLWPVRAMVLMKIMVPVTSGSNLKCQGVAF